VGSFLIGSTIEIGRTWRIHLVPGGTQPLKWPGYPVKAIIIIAWGNAPGTDESSTFWLKAINKSIEYGFQPKRAIKKFHLGRCPRLW